MVDYKYKDLFWQRHIDKQIKISTDDGLFTATNSDIHFEDFELEESLCSDSELRFGSCEASMVKFQIKNAFIPLIGKWLTITETLEGNADNSFRYGKYKVFSDKPTADREYRDIVAYDAIYDILSADVSAWYNALLPQKEITVTMKQFRKSFIDYFGIEQEEYKTYEHWDGWHTDEIVLANDNMVVERTIDPEQLSGKDVITAICEINGCFGHIGRDGKFHYIYLPQAIQGLYPANNLYPNHAPDYLPYQQEKGSLYPQDPKGERFGSGNYISCKYEDYVVRHINKIQIRQEENDIGTTYPKTEPSEKDNCYVIQDNFLVYGKSTEELDEIAKNIYGKITDISYQPFNSECPGNPCFEVGDPVRFMTKYNIVESYILKRTLKGIQGLRDNYSADGAERYSEEVNGIQKSIIQLKGKSNVLTRTVEENRLEMLDIEKKLSTELSILAGQFVLKVGSDGKMAIVKLEAKPDTGTEFKVEAKNISLSADDVITLMSGGTLNLTGENIEISSDNFTVDSQGNIECHNITAFSISGDAVNQFNSAVGSTEAMKLANEAIKKAQDSLAIALETIKNLNETIIPEINQTINDLQIDVAALKARVSALESE